MSTAVVCELTPTRKRKRDSEKLETNKNACFTNAAFSSTPKKISGRRRLNAAAVKENITPYANNSCMEVKSIAELVKSQKESEPPAIFNPYEVQRKPPKRKKREAAIEEACFENPALNLNVPEKQFNPFEVVRNVNNHEEQPKCFVNAALNIKAQDSTSVRNPFEIKRESSTTEDYSPKRSSGVENPTLKDAAYPTRLKIGIPFTPTVGCRIDFNNVSLTQLTPNKLLLAEKLVFSPVPNAVKPKRSLDAISEQSSSTSIGKELDRYQLELENSINEAKLRKNDENLGGEKIEEESVYQLQLKIEKRVSLNQRLTEIPEDEEEYEAEETEREIIEQRNEQVLAKKEINEVTTTTLEAMVTTETLQNNASSIEDQLKEPEFIFDSDNEEENLDFKAPAPFVRCYRRDIATKPKLARSKESLSSNSSTKSSSECIAEQKKHTSVKNFLRKSIRKMMPNHKQQQPEDQTLSNGLKTSAANKDDETKKCTLSSHIMSSIRHSLRRKPKSHESEVSKADSVPAIPLAEISIIDTSDRRMKLKSCALRNDYARIEELTNEKKHLLRNGSMMKTLFHKQEEYCFQK